MVRALRRWLEANELLAIVAGVVGGLADGSAAREEWSCRWQ